MKPAVVVDVGNSRIKWGRCVSDTIVDTASLPPDDPDAWQRQLDSWQIPAAQSWVLTGVHPERLSALAGWLGRQDQTVRSLDDWRQLGLEVRLERPERVGIDRLLNAVATKSRRRAGTPAVLVDAGSAITVDWLDAAGAFCGGAIFPGMRLMSQALHDYTALLPLVEAPRQPPVVPAVSTPDAVAAGVFWAAVGGIRALHQELIAHHSPVACLFVTGGDAAVLYRALGLAGELWPAMTLEGIRLTAEGLA